MRRDTSANHCNVLRIRVPLSARLAFEAPSFPYGSLCSTTLQFIYLSEAAQSSAGRLYLPQPSQLPAASRRTSLQALLHDYIMAPPNPTGFDKSTLVEASTSRVWQSRDPWARASVLEAPEIHTGLLTDSSQRDMAIHRSLYTVQSVQTGVSGIRHSNRCICGIPGLRGGLYERRASWAWDRTWR